MKKINFHEIPRISDRLTFLYLEYCKLERHQTALRACFIGENSDVGYTDVPIGMLSVLLLGPGTSFTHDAMILCADVGLSVLWVGEQGVRMYCAGTGLATSSRFLIRQAELVSNQQKRLLVARRMFGMRFDDDVDQYPLRELQLLEGRRMKQVYKQYADMYDIKFVRRYSGSFEHLDPVNQAITAGNQCLYGLSHAVITALGMATGLGFIHNGHALSFVFDVADFYKTELVIPLAFRIGTSGGSDVSGEMRRQLRDMFRESKLLVRMVDDIQMVLDISKEDRDHISADIVELWSYRQRRQNV